MAEQIDLRGADPRPRRLVKAHVYYSKTCVISRSLFCLFLSGRFTQIFTVLKFM